MSGFKAAALPSLLPAILRVGLSPGVLELARVDWRGRVLRRERVELPAAGAGWRDVMAALRAQLAGGTWRAGAAEVVLSSHFVHHCLLPDGAGINGAAEQAGYVRHLFRGEYGAAVDGWRVAVDHAGWGTRLACAVDAPLLEELRAACGAARLRLCSVRPHLAAAASRICRRIGAPPAWLAVLEPDVCALALLERGRWRHVARARLGNPSGAALFAVLRQQALALPEADAVRSVYVCGADAALAQAAEAGGWRIDVLTRSAGSVPAGLLPA